MKVEDLTPEQIAKLREGLAAIGDKARAEKAARVAEAAESKQQDE